MMLTRKSIELFVVALLAWGLAPFATALVGTLDDPPPVPASADCETTLQAVGAGFNWDVRACSGTCTAAGGGEPCGAVTAGSGSDPYPRYRYCACDETWTDPPKCCTIAACKSSSVAAWLPVAIGDCRNTPGAAYGCPDPGEVCDDVMIGENSRKAVCEFD